MTTLGVAREVFSLARCLLGKKATADSSAKPAFGMTTLGVAREIINLGRCLLGKKRQQQVPPQNPAFGMTTPGISGRLPMAARPSYYVWP